MKYVLAVLLAFGITFQANAGVTYAGHAKVKRFYPVGGTITYFMMEGAMVNPAGCPSQVYYAMGSDHPEFEEYRKLILTAKASGQKLGVYVWGDPGKCHGSYPLVYSIFIQ